MKLLDIAEVSEKAGLPPSTLRYYDEIGLITPAGRKGLRRQFTPDVVLQLALIEMGKMAGFSLDEIAGMFGSDAKAMFQGNRCAARQTSWTGRSAG